MAETLKLIKQDSTYKIVIPENVEEKIRFLCAQVHEVEWSGILFYKKSGTMEDGSLVITCADIFPMDIGTGTYTEFDNSPDAVSYMCDHPELLAPDVYNGLVHSHNNMATFFSGTDTSTLLEEGKDRNHFVSLIVNNAGTYTAAITRKAVKDLTISGTLKYKSFDDTEIELGELEPVKTQSTVVEYFMLEVEKHDAQVSLKKELEDAFSSTFEVLKTKVPADNAKQIRSNFVESVVNSLIRDVTDIKFEETKKRLDDIRESKKKKVTSPYGNYPFTGAYPNSYPSTQRTPAVGGGYAGATSPSNFARSKSQIYIPGKGWCDKDTEEVITPTSQLLNKGYTPKVVHSEPLGPSEPGELNLDWEDAGSAWAHCRQETTEEGVKSSEKTDKEIKEKIQELTDSALYYLLTGDIDCPNVICDYDSWAAQTGYIYSRQFRTLDDFKRFADMQVDYIYEVANDKLDGLTDDISNDSEAFMQTVADELKKLPQNVYIKHYISQIERLA